MIFKNEQRRRATKKKRRARRSTPELMINICLETMVQQQQPPNTNTVGMNPMLKECHEIHATILCHNNTSFRSFPYSSGHCRIITAKLMTINMDTVIFRDRFSSFYPGKENISALIRFKSTGFHGHALPRHREELKCQNRIE